MPHEVHASIQVLLPDDPSQMASTLSTIAAAWATLLDEIDPTPCTPTFAVNETRTRPANSTGPRRTRRPRQQPPPSPESTAAALTAAEQFEAEIAA